MRLKKIKLMGFKSFGDATHIEFIDGITAIVGPNGCGKSNVADAFRWVLGEQSAKSLRGNRMQDVIFSGTASRKALHYSEVSLTLTDIQGALPVDYEELTVSRRLDRDGDSEYFINKHPVRLRDVQSLFLDSGIGRSAFSIFEQGKIDQVIHLSPQERRVLFEEAAGILRFLQRKGEALKKLEQTDQNLSRAQDIHREIERQMVVLERQADEARQFKQQKELFEALDRSLLMHKHHQAIVDLQQLKESEHEIDQQSVQLTQSVEGRQSELKQLQEQSQQHARQLAEHREEILRIKGNREMAVRASETAIERLQEAQTNEKRWQIEIADMRHKSSQRAAERNTTEQALVEVEKHLKEVGAELDRCRSRANTAEDRLAALRTEQSRFLQERFKNVQEENRIHTELTQAKMRCEQVKQRLVAMDRRQEQLSSQLEQMQSGLSEKRQQLEGALQAVETAKQRSLQLETQLRDAQSAHREAQKTWDDAKGQVTELKARENALLRLQQDFEGFNKSSKRLLQESSNVKSPLYGKLKPLFTQVIPKPGCETAVAALLRPYSQTMVVDAIEDLKLVVNYAKQHELTDYSLICVENQARRLKEGVSQHETIATSSLSVGLTSPAQVVDDNAGLLEALCRGEEGPICSLDGWLVDAHQVLIAANKGVSDPFLRESELRTLCTKREAGESKLATAEKMLFDLRHERERLQGERTALEGVLRTNELKRMEMSYALQTATADLERGRAEFERLTRDKAVANRDLEGFNTSLGLLQEHISSLQVTSSLSNQRLTDVENELSGLTAALKHEQHALKQQEQGHSRIVDEQRRLTHILSLLAVKEHEAQLHEKRLELEIRNGHCRQETLRNEESEQSGLAQKMAAQLVDYQQAQVTFELALADSKRKIAESTAETERIHSQLRKREREISQLRIQIAELRAQANALAQELQERYNIDENGLMQQSPALEFSIAETERQLKALRSALDEQQNVNMTSIAEYEAQQERYQFLSEQIGDLVAAKQELNGIIGQLDEESRRLFKDTFQIIRQNFKKNFQILFEGGEADIQLAEGIDILEAGVEIIAKPPGKQMRSIQLLSGGEKCLTALALLFALFEVKPAPFCVLDEIDAPLDESNVGRFVNMVRHFSDRCQFIIITHNKTTMSIADVLVGVSMQEKGISKVVSMSFASDSNVALLH